MDPKTCRHPAPHRITPPKKSDTREMGTVFGASERWYKAGSPFARQQRKDILQNQFSLYAVPLFPVEILHRQAQRSA